MGTDADQSDSSPEESLKTIPELLASIRRQSLPSIPESLPLSPSSLAPENVTPVLHQPQRIPAQWESWSPNTQGSAEIAAPSEASNLFSLQLLLPITPAPCEWFRPPRSARFSLRPSSPLYLLRGSQGQHPKETFGGGKAATPFPMKENTDFFPLTQPITSFWESLA